MWNRRQPNQPRNRCPEEINRPNETPLIGGQRRRTAVCREILTESLASLVWATDKLRCTGPRANYRLAKLAPIPK